jgi:ribosomal protein S18 acetylase RimI-like enzyme
MVSEKVEDAIMEIYEAKEVTDELVEAFQRLVPQLSTTAKAPGRKELQEIVDSPAVLLFMVREDGKIIGSLSLIVFRVPSGVRAWIEDVIVDESMRGRGIGEAVTRVALDRAKELGVKTVDLTSRPAREAANRLYVRVGFELRNTNTYRYKIQQPG